MNTQSLPFYATLNHRPLVCVQGLGFVGLAMATVLANAKSAKGEPRFNVIGVDLAGRDDFYRTVNSGELPFKTEDLTFAPELHNAVHTYRNFHATCEPAYYQLADVVVCDVHLDVGAQQGKPQVHDSPFREAIRTLGRYIKPECLVLVETTVPPGFCERVVEPVLREEFQSRGIKTTPLVAHSYERVMPGKEYLSSIRNFYRTFSALTPEAAERAREFLMSFISTETHPLREEASPNASELAKVLENSFRAMNIAFIYEWTLLAEKMGVNLFSVIEGIRNRPTHKNIMKPGFGVGGYCLTKDSLLAAWSAEHFFDAHHGLPFSTQSLLVNKNMPLHTLRRIQERGQVAGQMIAVLGVSYREDVGDTRYSPAEIFCQEAAAGGATLVLHDPYVEAWPERPQDRFIAWNDLSAADVVVLATRHRQYLETSASAWVELTKPGSLIVDANDILTDDKIRQLLKAGREVIGIGKGHIEKLRSDV